MKKVLLFVLFFGVVFFPNSMKADTSNIAKLAFITEPQTISPNQVSKEITLQIQDASGNKVAALETIRFDAFKSTSPSGVFVSCTTPTNPPTDYISRNNYNKNICYKDSTEGVYTITAKTNNTSIPLEATQNITVSSATVPPPVSGTSTATSTASSTDQTDDSSSGSNSSGSYYVYSSSAYLSNYEPLSLSVEAGRERLAFLHTPVEFKSYARDRKTGKSIIGGNYYWTFGDGSSAQGSVVNHTYQFPGEYNVVLNSNFDNEEAVDITKVKVILPEVKISFNDSYIEFTNKNSTDLNIGGWKIKGNDKEYIIPRDTIVSANGSLKIPTNIMSSILNAEKISIQYPDNQLALEIKNISSVERQKQIDELSQRLLSLQNDLNLAYADPNYQSEFTGEENNKNVADANIVTEGEKKANDASLANSISAPASQNIVSKFLNFFSSMFR